MSTATKRFIDVVLATALLGAVCGAFTWIEPIGGFDRVTTTLMSMVGGAVLGAIIGVVAYVIGRFTGS